MSERDTGEVNGTSLVSCVFHNNTKQQGGAGEWLTRTAGTWKDKLQAKCARTMHILGPDTSDLCKTELGANVCLISS